MGPFATGINASIQIPTDITPGVLHFWVLCRVDTATVVPSAIYSAFTGLTRLKRTALERPTRVRRSQRPAERYTLDSTFGCTMTPRGEIFLSIGSKSVTSSTNDSQRNIVYLHFMHWLRQGQRYTYSAARVITNPTYRSASTIWSAWLD